MKVSVIVPTYKPGDYLRECLNSLTRQDMKTEDFEVLLILNGCNEPYYSSINSWINGLRKDGHHCSNIRVIQTDEPGVSNARNIGMENAMGEYFCFVDDDDYVSSTYLTGLYSVASPDCISLAHPVAFNDNGRLKHYGLESSYYQLYGKGRMPYYKARRFFGGPWIKLIHSNLGGVKFDTNFRNGEDSLYMFEMSQAMHFVRCADPDVVYYRRIRKESANQNQSLSYRIKNQSRLIAKYCSLYIKNPDRYSVRFFITRILGAVKAMVLK